MQAIIFNNFIPTRGIDFNNTIPQKGQGFHLHAEHIYRKSKGVPPMDPPPKIRLEC